MKMKVLIGLVMILILPVLGIAQAAPASQTPEAPQPKPEINAGAHVDVETSYLKLLSGGQATLIAAGVPLTPRYTLFYDQVLIPDAKASFYFGAVRFSEVLSHILKSRAKDFYIPTDNIEIFLQGGVGTRRDELAKNPAFAYEAQGGLNYRLGDIAGGKLSAGVKIGIVGSPRNGVAPAGRFLFANSVGVSPGVKLQF